MSASKKEKKSIIILFCLNRKILKKDASQERNAVIALLAITYLLDILCTFFFILVTLNSEELKC
jgi:hypothetical protein